MEWQPIDTAPKGGVAVLGLWMPSPGALARVTGNNYGIVACEANKSDWYLVDDGDEYDRWVMRPDYWMPLPEPPK